MDQDVGFLLDVALEHSDDEEVNYHIRTPLQHIQIDNNPKELETE